MRLVFCFKDGDSQGVVQAEKIICTTRLAATRFVADEIDTPRRERFPSQKIVLTLDLTLSPTCGFQLGVNQFCSCVSSFNPMALSTYSH
jgi:hypothetical protein